MGAIVCATRGGGASYRTQERATALAKERDEELVFLCVVDDSFAGPLDERLAAALDDELKRLGRSLLNIAEVRARERGVSSRTVCISGPVWDGIKGYLEKANASTLVIGSSRSGVRHQAFDSGDVDGFAEMLRQTLDLEVIVVS
jgi:nucleotide-binding universal stress UspA family protein